MPQLHFDTVEANIRTVHATCSLDCPDSCGILATVDASTNRVVKIQGDPSHPITRGFLCGKVAKYLDRVYSPDRLLHPMRRRAGIAKGQLAHGCERQAFEQITWEEALTTIATRLQQVSDEHGPESILPYSYAGTIGQLGYGGMDRRFFHRLGASQLDRTICASAGGAALLDVYGAKLAMPTETFADARLILAWGANIHGNNIHLWPFIEQARRNGARLVVIDPYATRTARLADLHLAIRPGTDAALALGLMHVILRDNLQNDAYIASSTHGIAALRARVLTQEYCPEHVARITGLTAQQITTLARQYATTIPAAIRMNYGIQRSENGGTAARAVAMLPLLTGAWQHRGGGLMLSSSGAFPFNQNALQMPELMQASPLGREARTINMSQLGHALTTVTGPAVHALFVYNSNPAAVSPNQTTVLSGMRRDDLFTVVHDQFLTDTADYADIVLPAPSWLEQTDVQGAYCHYYAQLSHQAMPPLGEARSNTWLFGQLGQQMGFAEPCFRDTEDALIDQVLTTPHPWMKTVTRTRLRAEGHVELDLPRNANGDFLPFSDASWFRTPSGKGEFASSALAAQGLDPVPAYRAPQESPSSANPHYPLQMLARKADNWMNSTFANIPTHRHFEQRTLNTLEIAAPDAAARHIADGDEVEVFNDRGTIRLRAIIGTATSAGVVASRLGWNKLSADGNGINVLTSERLTDLGGGATFYSTLVEVRKASKTATAEGK